MSQEHPAVAGGVSGPEEVLSYWLPQGINDADLQTLRRQGKRWMAGGSEVARAVTARLGGGRARGRPVMAGGSEVERERTERLGEVLEQARRGELDHWADTPRGRLALIIVLDQFSRNIYRGSPLSYSQDEKALKLALEGIDLGMDRELGAVERLFFRLPLVHSEDLALHERGVRHAEEEAAKAPPHRRALAEFGGSQAPAARHG